MKELYKIYQWPFGKISNPIPSPVDSPDFITYADAEDWLMKQDFKIEEWGKTGIRFCYFIAKTYLYS